MDPTGIATIEALQLCRSVTSCQNGVRETRETPTACLYVCFTTHTYTYKFYLLTRDSWVVKKWRWGSRHTGARTSIGSQRTRSHDRHGDFAKGSLNQRAGECCGGRCTAAGWTVVNAALVCRGPRRNGATACAARKNPGARNVRAHYSYTAGARACRHLHRPSKMHMKGLRCARRTRARTTRGTRGGARLHTCPLNHKDARAGPLQRWTSSNCRCCSSNRNLRRPSVSGSRSRR